MTKFNAIRSIPDNLAAAGREALRVAAFAACRAVGYPIDYAAGTDLQAKFEQLHNVAGNINEHLEYELGDARRKVSAAKADVETQNATIKAAQAELRRLYDVQRDAEIELDAQIKRVESLRSLLPKRSDNPEPHIA